MKKNNLKRTLALATSAFALSAAFVGCTDYSEFSEADFKHLDDLQKYNEAFEKSIGKPDPNHDWGMDEHIGVIGAYSLPITRVGDPQVNRNQWTEFTGTTDKTFPTYNYAPKEVVPVPNFNSNALGHDIQIPGFPHLNGLYYVADGNFLTETKKGSQITSGMIPAGDVTPYEIQYVSNWFRTHKNPTSNVHLHLSDFFIQNISSDKDQVEYKTTSITPYKTGWEKTGNNGDNIETVDEAKAHKAADGTTPYVTEAVNEHIDYYLDQLGFRDMAGDWTHVNNFNSGNSNFDPENNASNANRMIIYVKSSGTEKFRCHPSWSTQKQWIEDYVLVKLTWVETVKDPNSPYPEGTEIPREGYYLGFDFSAEKEGGKVVNRDGYYSNWIVKITPGYFAPTGNSRRIMCEDLGGSFDFDFNDAVIDVAFEGNGDSYTPIISVQAAGGTMPIYVEKKDPNYELHRMLGKTDNETAYVPTNVGSGRTHPIAIYRGTPVSSDQASQIHIYVNNTKHGGEYEIAGASTPDANGNTSSINVSGGSSTLDGSTLANKTVAPSAFSVPTSVKWMKEEKTIHTLGYEQFPNWVADHTQNADWYNYPKANAPLVDLSQVEHGTGEFAPPTFDDNSSDYHEVVQWEELVPDPNGDARTTAAAVGADSYMRINGYQGNLSPIMGNLESKGPDGRVTFVVILSADAADYNAVDVASGTTSTKTLQGIITPADINTTNNPATMSYKGVDFATADFTRYKKATYIPGQDFKVHDPNDTDEPDSKTITRYTYMMEFSFSKAHVTRLNGEDFHDYILFFLNGQDINTGGGNATGENGNIKVEKWYVHY